MSSIDYLPNDLVNEIFEYYHPTMNAQRNHMKKVCLDFEHITKAKLYGIHKYKLYSSCGFFGMRIEFPVHLFYPHVKYMHTLLNLYDSKPDFYTLKLKCV